MKRNRKWRIRERDEKDVDISLIAREIATFSEGLWGVSGRGDSMGEALRKRPLRATFENDRRPIFTGPLEGLALAIKMAHDRGERKRAEGLSKVLTGRLVLELESGGVK